MALSLKQELLMVLFRYVFKILMFKVTKVTIYGTFPIKLMPEMAKTFFES